jgi:hypothetical protein
MGVKPFAAGNTLESLRDSDFDSCSAYGEVIDNSLQANATQIKIHFEEKGRGQIGRVIFMDDGDGMDLETIQNCLRLGWSSRYNDRSGIGRFGVGMTLGAIHECRRIEVFSKTNSGKWLFTYLDLDEIEDADKQGNEWEIPEPSSGAPTDSLPPAYIPRDKGTIVVWSKYDRASDKVQKILKDFDVWLGRTYRYFIWGTAPSVSSQIQIELNGSEVRAIDPLYLKTECTRFPEDPVARQYDNIQIEWPINDPRIVRELGRDKAVITIKLSLLPDEFRSYQGAGLSKASKDRSIDLNEGFSFMRRGREVGYDWIPHFKFGSMDLDRFWGCEISFDPELDRSFTVKNIKRGAVPSVELKAAIADKIAPWIKHQRELISEHWRKKTPDPRPGEEPTGTHPLSEKIAISTQVPKGKADSGLDVTVEAPRVAEIYSDGVREEAAKLAARFQSQPYTIIERAWVGPTFIDIHFMGGSDALLYNTRHIFFDVFSTIKAELKDGVNLEYNSDRLVVLVDLLLVAYAKSEAMFSGTDRMDAADFAALLKNNWGQFLKMYIQTWRDEYDKDIQS